MCVESHTPVMDVMRTFMDVMRTVMDVMMDIIFY